MNHKKHAKPRRSLRDGGRQRFRLVAVLGLAALVGGGGCGDGDGGDVGPTPTRAATPRSTPISVDFQTATPRPSPTPFSVDLSTNLVEFEFERDRAAGFCPPLDSVFGAHVVRQEHGEFLLSLSILEETTTDDPACLLVFVGDVPCAREVPLPMRILTADEVGRLEAAFRSVAIVEPRDPQCETIAFDPCVINRFRWVLAAGDTTNPDRVTFLASGFLCERNHLSAGEQQPLIAVLDTLR